jgi:hypothetical protein
VPTIFIVAFGIREGLPQKEKASRSQRTDAFSLFWEFEGKIR